VPALASGRKSNLPIAKIVGSVLGALLLIVAVLAIVVKFCKRRSAAAAHKRRISAWRDPARDSPPASEALVMQIHELIQMRGLGNNAQRAPFLSGDRRLATRKNQQMSAVSNRAPVVRSFARDMTDPVGVEEQLPPEYAEN
jgi:hypothetical protein